MLPTPRPRAAYSIGLPTVEGALRRLFDRHSVSNRTALARLADIARTVAVSPTLESIAVLSGIVLVQTFLSFSLEVELTGMWPWQRGRDGYLDQPVESGRREELSEPIADFV